MIKSSKRRKGHYLSIVLRGEWREFGDNVWAPFVILFRKVDHEQGSVAHRDFKKHAQHIDRRQSGSLETSWKSSSLCMKAESWSHEKPAREILSKFVDHIGIKRNDRAFWMTIST